MGNIGEVVREGIFSMLDEAAVRGLWPLACGTVGFVYDPRTKKFNSYGGRKVSCVNGKKTIVDSNGVEIKPYEDSEGPLEDWMEDGAVFSGLAEAWGAEVGRSSDGLVVRHRPSPPLHGYSGPQGQHGFRLEKK